MCRCLCEIPHVGCVLKFKVKCWQLSIIYRKTNTHLLCKLNLFYSFLFSSSNLSSQLYSDVNKIYKFTRKQKFKRIKMLLFEIIIIYYFHIELTFLGFSSNAHGTENNSQVKVIRWKVGTYYKKSKDWGIHSRPRVRLRNVLSIQKLKRDNYS